MLRRARQLLGDEDEAADIMQDVFSSLWHRPEQYGGRAALSTWLYRATTNLCLNRMRNRSNRDRLLVEKVAPAIEREGASAAAETLARQVLSQMPVDLAQAAIHYFMDGMTHEEVAQVMDCSPRHVGNLIKRAQRWAQQREVAQP